VIIFIGVENMIFIIFIVYFVIVISLAITSIVFACKASKQNKALIQRHKEIFEEYEKGLKKINDKYSFLFEGDKDNVK